MNSAMIPLSLGGLSQVTQEARRLYMEQVVTPSSAVRWWTAVVITASSQRQAAAFQEETFHRQQKAVLPAGARFLVVPDLNDQRIGSGGATFNALRALAESALPETGSPSLESWWQTQKVLILHSGGDSRRLPQYSLTGKLFSTLPVKAPWGEYSTVFDEFLALSTLWASRLNSGLLLASGDVLLAFDASNLRWERPGVSGVAMLQPAGIGIQHGVYVIDERGQVYAFLQKPSFSQLKAAGGLLPGGLVGLDTGLLRFDVSLACGLTELAGISIESGHRKIVPGILKEESGTLPSLDLYEHFTKILTGQWLPSVQTSPAMTKLARLLGGQPFWCDLVQGEFTHVGTTRLFRQLMTEESSLTQLYQAQQKMGQVIPPGFRSAGIIVDSVVSAGGELGAGALAIECELNFPVRAGRGAILHGVTDLDRPLEIPEDTVVHPVPVNLPSGVQGTAIRVYGVADDPKAIAGTGAATWFGRPLLQVIQDLGMDVGQVWPEIHKSEWSLWNALLFPIAAPEQTWECAQWMMGLESGFTPARWSLLPRVSLASSAHWADNHALATARSRRSQARWQATAVSLALAGSDVRPLLEQSPAPAALAATGGALIKEATRLADTAPTQAASHLYQAHLFLSQAGLAQEADQALKMAFQSVQRAVDAGDYEDVLSGHKPYWCFNTVEVSAPARCDFGGGWSDTPPFCLDWGGTVLNAALSVDGIHPIQTVLHRLPKLLIRCVSDDSGDVIEYRSMEEILAPLEPGSPFSIPRVALQMVGFASTEETLEAALRRAGGGLEIRTSVKLPMGSGLGTSSILAATLIRALTEMSGLTLSDRELMVQVMRLEQLLTTGGGWQDQVGGIFPGIKLISSGPGIRQRLRVEPVSLPSGRLKEFEDRFLLYYTGIRRVAKDLLVQVVGRYLAREVEAVQVLHSIKTLAWEMAYAMREGEWEYLGTLMDRHWELNQKLDPNTTNSLIEAQLRVLRPYLAGLKLAGAGGGGFLMLLAKNPDTARAVRDRLAQADLPGSLHEYHIAEKGISVTLV